MNDDNAVNDFFTYELPKICESVRQLGRKANRDGKPMDCTLDEEFMEKYSNNGKPLKVYKQIWEQGWTYQNQEYVKEKEQKMKNLKETILFGWIKKCFL